MAWRCAWRSCTGWRRRSAGHDNPYPPGWHAARGDLGCAAAAGDLPAERGRAAFHQRRRSDADHQHADCGRAHRVAARGRCDLPANRAPRRRRAVFEIWPGSATAGRAALRSRALRVREADRRGRGRVLCRALPGAAAARAGHRAGGRHPVRLGRAAVRLGAGGRGAGAAVWNRHAGLAVQPLFL